MKRIVVKFALGFGISIFAIAFLNVAESGQAAPGSSAKAKFLGGPITTFTADGTIPSLSTSSGSCDTDLCVASQGHCSCSKWSGISGKPVTKLGRSKIQTTVKITTNEDDCTVTPSGSCCSIDGAVEFKRNADVASIIFTGESCAGVIAGSYQMLQGAGEFAAAIGVGDLQGTINSSDGSLGFSIVGIAQFL
jgi:hypothetical protein